MKKNPIQPVLGPILLKIAPKIGAKVFIEPKWKIVGQIVFRNGVKRYFRYSSLDLNPLGASDIAKDKDYANFFMKRMGYPTVQGEAFYSDEWAEAIASDRTIQKAYAYAKRIGFPVIVKPNSGSQGTNVAFVRSKAEFFRAMRAIFKRDRVALVQRHVAGRDYRVVVLDDSVISAYERIPLNIVGDGHSPIISLLNKKQRDFIASSRDTRINFNDPRIACKLRSHGMSLRFIPAKGMRVLLLDNANLSTGGDAVEVRRIHPEFKRLAIRLTKDMGLRLCGVDLIVQGSLEEEPEKFWILEVNAAPGLDHYARTGGKQERTVEAMYLKVLKCLERSI